MPPESVIELDEPNAAEEGAGGMLPNGAEDGCCCPPPPKPPPNPPPLLLLCWPNPDVLEANDPKPPPPPCCPWPKPPPKVAPPPEDDAPNPEPDDAAPNPEEDGAPNPDDGAADPIPAGGVVAADDPKPDSGAGVDPKPDSGAGATDPNPDEPDNGVAPKPTEGGAPNPDEGGCATAPPKPPADCCRTGGPDVGAPNPVEGAAPKPVEGGWAAAPKPPKPPGACWPLPLLLVLPNPPPKAEGWPNPVLFPPPKPDISNAAFGDSTRFASLSLSFLFNNEVRRQTAISSATAPRFVGVSLLNPVQKGRHLACQRPRPGLETSPPRRLLQGRRFPNDVKPTSLQVVSSSLV